MHARAHTHTHTRSGAGTHLKVGGAHVRLEALGKIFVVPLHFFGSIQLVVLVSAFTDHHESLVSWSVLSVSCMLYFYSWWLRAQPFVKVGARAPVPYGVGATAHTHTHIAKSMMHWRLNRHQRCQDQTPQMRVRFLRRSMHTDPKRVRS